MNSITSIGHQLVETRRAMGMSQRELGESVGVAQQQIARWEATHYRTARLDSVAAVVDALRTGDDHAGLLAAEAPTPYKTDSDKAVRPVRDLGEVAARIRRHSPTFHERYGIDRVGVFGSFATGNQRPDSDVDLLVGADEPGGFRFLEAADFAQIVLGRRVDFMRPETLKTRLRPQVMRDVIWIWHA